MIEIHAKLPVIYKITNMINGKVYIGQTVDFHRRVIEYRTRNPEKSSSSKYGIMLAIKQYGIDNFRFEIIHTCRSEDELTKMEYYFIEKYKSHDPKYGYNSKHLTIDGEACNYQTRLKMSESHKGLKESANTKKKKSKKIIAVNDNEFIISDSCKLFADYIGTDRAVVSHAHRDCATTHGYYIISTDKNTRALKVEGCADYKYISLVNMIDNEDVETIKSRYNVKYLTYID